MRIILISTLMVLVVTAAFVMQMKSSDYFWKTEGFSNPSGVTAISSIELADFNQGLPLSDMLTTRTGLSALDSKQCADEDSSRILEPVSNYGQQTNNYRRNYPDNCSAPLTEFVGAFYQPK